MVSAFKKLRKLFKVHMKIIQVFKEISRQLTFKYVEVFTTPHISDSGPHQLLKIVLATQNLNWLIVSWGHSQRLGGVTLLEVL